MNRKWDELSAAGGELSECSAGIDDIRKVVARVRRLFELPRDEHEEAVADVFKGLDDALDELDIDIHNALSSGD